MLTYKKEEITQKIFQFNLVQATCDACTKLITIQHNNPVGVLHFNFNGGYGDYIDGNVEGIFCTECANKLKAIFPKIFKEYFNGLNFLVDNTTIINDEETENDTSGF